MSIIEKLISDFGIERSMAGTLGFSMKPKLASMRQKRSESCSIFRRRDSSTTGTVAPFTVRMTFLSCSTL